MTELTHDLRDLVRLAADEDAVSDLIRRGLDWLARLADYDLAVFFELRDDDRLVSRCVRGRLASEQLRAHELRLDDFPTVREALETRRARAYTEDDHAHGDGDPFDGVLDLPHGHACMVAPVCAAGEVYGLITLDRSECQRYPPNLVELVEVYAQLLGIAIRASEQREALQRLARAERERVRILERDRGAEDALDILAGAKAASMRAVVERASQAAPTDTPILILGETGTGKERLARAIHLSSGRRDGPFVPINCAAIPPALLESELFGHVRGAFTGATRDRPGRFQMADGGSLLLDEIGELPVELQAKLLRVLQEGSFEPVGSDRTVSVDVRVLAATHVDLDAAIRDGRFREDLYYRLGVFPLSLPPLRDRTEDLPGIVSTLLRDLAHRTGRLGRTVTAAGLAKLAAHDWPGNVRELANVLERATIIAPGAELGPEVIDLPERDGPGRIPLARAPRDPFAATDEDDAGSLLLEDVDRRHIRRVLRVTDGRIYGEGGAAELLGLKPSTLQSRMKKLGIRRVEPR